MLMAGHADRSAAEMNISGARSPAATETAKLVPKMRAGVVNQQ